MSSEPVVRIRQPPIGDIIRQHLPKAPGKCYWCGEPVTERTPVRHQLKQLHNACRVELDIITNPAAAREALKERDKGVCCDCHQDWSERYRFRRGPEVFLYTDSQRYLNHVGPYAYGLFRYTEVVWISLWHAEHKVPLWKVVTLPAVQRIEYFKLANLVTRCEPCHIAKTSDEAGDKAKYDRLDPTIEQASKPTRTWPKRSMRAGDGRPRVKDINDDLK